ncbi:universal stress protein [Streptomonospora algeriensis]|uniref:Universal stress protein n=1 Tax=Streptomonospora algeriensis TaxID=995084 RepID=A0ABW3BAM0_9ACTN
MEARPNRGTRRRHRPAAGVRVSPVTRLVVPLDGSREAESAIDPTLRIARTLQVPVELMTVHDPVRGKWERNVDETAAALAYDHVEVTVVGSGWAGDVIVDTIAEQAGTVACMATHNRDRFSRLVAGSVTEHVLHTAPGPVLMVGPGYRPDHSPDAYRRALVCLDHGARDESGIALAQNWAEQLKLELELVYVATAEEDTRASEKRTARLAEHIADGGTPVGYTQLVGSDPAEEIAELLGQRPGSIAVLANRGRVGIARSILGSVSSRLLETSPAPLVLTRAP